MNGKEHWDKADRILDRIQNESGQHDAAWMLAHSTRALAHATLAGAARDYGLHVPPKEVVISQITGEPLTGVVSVDLGIETIGEFTDRLRTEMGEFQQGMHLDRQLISLPDLRIVEGSDFVPDAGRRNNTVPRPDEYITIVEPCNCPESPCPRHGPVIREQS